MSGPFRVLVVDDEAPARAKVKRLLAQDPRFALAGEAADGHAALRLLQDEASRPDLLLLDVQMPGLTGFEVLEALGEAAPAVVFSTAYDQYALSAFEAAALDYLLKPYDAERFRRALDRAHVQLAAGRVEAPGALLQAVQPRLERLIVRQGEGWVPLRLDAVTRLTAEDKYVRLHAGGREHLVRQTLKALEARLDPGRFVRVHRSELVALEAVARLEPWTHGDGLLVMQDGSTVVLSRTHRDAFLARWGVEG
ncbi:response regulator transcription factor [Aggregicoccus sp. 17bor-14]|uniref:LytR/AlgR family response regulator transcription factor n=1 Tax=Myxococcaceae TaxID=31 RepID=UPI0012F2F58C|nr:response regulator transcription factor [Simulacricoccus sp. 17bor-14]MRI89098.1 response regulator transcription factor [Aggregicoccus sp. 17bor-14]